MTDIEYSVKEAAMLLEIARGTVIIRAQRYGCGHQTGGGYWRFTPADIKTLRETKDRRFRKQ